MSLTIPLPSLSLLCLLILFVPMKSFSFLYSRVHSLSISFTYLHVTLLISINLSLGFSPSLFFCKVKHIQWIWVHSETYLFLQTRTVNKDSTKDEWDRFHSKVRKEYGQAPELRLLNSITTEPRKLSLSWTTERTEHMNLFLSFFTVKESVSSQDSRFILSLLLFIL